MKLQSLKIPVGWYIQDNKFYDIPATKENVENIEMYFLEDILQLTNEYRNRLLDLGWYPEGDFENGSFKLVVYDGDFNGNLLFEYSSKNKDDVTSMINNVLWQITSGGL